MGLQAESRRKRARELGLTSLTTRRFPRLYLSEVVDSHTEFAAVSRAKEKKATEDRYTQKC
jgi:hypothetical protein